MFNLKNDGCRSGDQRRMANSAAPRHKNNVTSLKPANTTEFTEQCLCQSLFCSRECYP